MRTRAVSPSLSVALAALALAAGAQSDPQNPVGSVVGAVGSVLGNGPGGSAPSSRQGSGAASPLDLPLGGGR